MLSGPVAMPMKIHRRRVVIGGRTSPQVGRPGLDGSISAKNINEIGIYRFPETADLFRRTIIK